MRNKFDIYKCYWAMVSDWTAIVDREEPVAARQEACLTLLVDLVQKIAITRIGQIDAPLRFYADMLSLQELLRPKFLRGELGDIAVIPCYKVVSDWIFDNNNNKKSYNLFCDLNIYRYMQWQQLRAIMVGEQKDFAALDRDARYSDYVRSIIDSILIDQS